MVDDSEERFQQHEDILRRLTAMRVEQREMNHRMEGFMQQQVEINQAVHTTLSRIETLLNWTT